MLIVFECNIVDREVIDVFDSGVEPECRQRQRLARQLLIDLIEMIEVNVCICQRMHKFTWLLVGHLRNHREEQCVRRDIKRHAQKRIC